MKIHNTSSSLHKFMLESEFMQLSSCIDRFRVYVHPFVLHFTMQLVLNFNKITNFVLYLSKIIRNYIRNFGFKKTEALDILIVIDW